MSQLFDTLLSTRLLAALIVFAVASALLELALARLESTVSEAPFSEWLLASVGAPLSRALTLMLFVAVAYPALFGLHTAPPLGQVLAAGSDRPTTLLNVAMVVTLLLPLLPVVGRPHWVLPLQGATVAALVSHWAGLAHGVWPGWTALVLMAGFASLGAWAASGVADAVGSDLDRAGNWDGSEQLVYRGLLLFFQVPAILVYTLALGGGI